MLTLVVHDQNKPSSSVWGSRLLGNRILVTVDIFMAMRSPTMTTYITLQETVYRKT